MLGVVSSLWDKPTMDQPFCEKPTVHNHTGSYGTGHRSSSQNTGNLEKESSAESQGNSKKGLLPGKAEDFLHK